MLLQLQYFWKCFEYFLLYVFLFVFVVQKNRFH